MDSVLLPGELAHPAAGVEAKHLLALQRIDQNDVLLVGDREQARLRPKGERLAGHDLRERNPATRPFAGKVPDYYRWFAVRPVETGKGDELIVRRKAGRTGGGEGQRDVLGPSIFR